MKKVENMENGQAVNNVEVKDMSPKPFEGLSHEQVMAIVRQREIESTKNYVEIIATPREKEIILGKDIIDKQTGLPKLDSEGNVLRYSNKYYVDLSFDGGVLKKYPCKKEMFDEIEEGVKHRFIGYMGTYKNFGDEIIAPIFTSWNVF